MSDSERRVLMDLPGEWFFNGPKLLAGDGSAELVWSWREDDTDYSGGLHFEVVRAYRHVTEGHSTAWHVRESYDRLVEIADSAWLQELATAEGAQIAHRWNMRHFLVYIEDSGPFEFAAESWSWMQPVRVGTSDAVPHRC